MPLLENPIMKALCYIYTVNLHYHSFIIIITYHIKFLLNSPSENHKIEIIHIEEEKNQIEKNATKIEISPVIILMFWLIKNTFYITRQKFLTIPPYFIFMCINEYR